MDKESLKNKVEIRVYVQVKKLYCIFLFFTSGYTINIPDTIMALTIVAFGVSLPDVISSLIVVREGRQYPDLW